ncbi:MAG: lipopolysaccharide heptosyltransferase I [Thermodesulfobacteriota bacterium]
MRILIVKTSAIGDVIHTLPALHCLRRHYPEAHITWLVEKAAADVVVGHPALDRVLVAGRREWITEWRAGGRRSAFSKAWHFVRELRDSRYDLLVDFQGLLKSGIWVALARARRKVGFGRGMEHAEMSYLFLNERLPAVSMEMHAVDRELHLLRAIGVECPEVRFDLPLTAADHLAAQNLLESCGMALDQPFIAINPMTTWPTKHWRPEKFAELADRLAGAGRKVVFTGGPADRSGIAAIGAMMRQPPVNLAGATTLKTLAALFGRAQAVVSTDTGPMHIAAAMGTPVVALFGPTAPWRTGPYGAKHQVIRLGLDCSPCLKKQCQYGTIACMADIPVSDVAQAIMHISGEA